jgi:hypothetical protein
LIRIDGLGAASERRRRTWASFGDVLYLAFLMWFSLDLRWGSFCKKKENETPKNEEM